MATAWNPNALSRSALTERAFDFPTIHAIDMFSPLQLARLCIPGITRVSKFGLCMNVTNNSDLWFPGGSYPWPTEASEWEIVSSSPLDTALGTGAQAVGFAGLDAGLAIVPAVVATLNGTTPVQIPGGPYFRFQGMKIAAAGGLLRNQGTITVRPLGGGAAIGVMPPLRGLDKAAIWTVPAGHTLYITEVAYAMLTNNDVRNSHGTILFRRRVGSGYVEAEDADIVVRSSAPYTRITLATPVAMPAESDLAVRTLAVSHTPMALSGGFHGILVNEEAYGY